MLNMCEHNARTAGRAGHRRASQAFLGDRDNAHRLAANDIEAHSRGVRHYAV